MNAAQRRIARRTILAALPLSTPVLTPTGSEGKVVGVNRAGNGVLVKLKNNRTQAYRPSRLSIGVHVYV